MPATNLLRAAVLGAPSAATPIEPDLSLTIDAGP